MASANQSSATKKRDKNNENDGDALNKRLTDSERDDEEEDDLTKSRTTRSKKANRTKKQESSDDFHLSTVVVMNPFFFLKWQKRRVNAKMILENHPHHHNMNTELQHNSGAAFPKEIKKEPKDETENTRIINPHDSNLTYYSQVERSDIIKCNFCQDEKTSSGKLGAALKSMSANIEIKMPASQVLQEEIINHDMKIKPADFTYEDTINDEKSILESGFVIPSSSPIGNSEKMNIMNELFESSNLPEHQINQACASPPTSSSAERVQVKIERPDETQLNIEESSNSPADGRKQSSLSENRPETSDIRNDQIFSSKSEVIEQLKPSQSIKCSQSLSPVPDVDYESEKCKDTTASEEEIVDQKVAHSSPLFKPDSKITFISDDEGNQIDMEILPATSSRLQKNSFTFDRQEKAIAKTNKKAPMSKESSSDFIPDSQDDDVERYVSKRLQDDDSRPASRLCDRSRSSRYTERMRKKELEISTSSKTSKSLTTNPKNGNHWRGKPSQQKWLIKDTSKSAKTQQVRENSPKPSTSGFQKRVAPTTDKKSAAPRKHRTQFIQSTSSSDEIAFTSHSDDDTPIGFKRNKKKVLMKTNHKQSSVSAVGKVEGWLPNLLSEPHRTNRRIVANQLEGKKTKTVRSSISESTFSSLKRKASEKEKKESGSKRKKLFTENGNADSHETSSEEQKKHVQPGGKRNTEKRSKVNRNKTSSEEEEENEPISKRKFYKNNKVGRNKTSSEEEEEDEPGARRKLKKNGGTARNRRSSSSDNDSVFGEMGKGRNRAKKKMVLERPRPNLAISIPYHPRKLFDYEEDKAMVLASFYHISAYQTSNSKFWEEVKGSEPQLAHRPIKSLRNRYVRYLKDNWKIYIKDPAEIAEIKRLLKNKKR